MMLCWVSWLVTCQSISLFDYSKSRVKMTGQTTAHTCVPLSLYTIYLFSLYLVRPPVRKKYGCKMRSNLMLYNDTWLQFIIDAFTPRKRCYLYVTTHFNQPEFWLPCSLDPATSTSPETISFQVPRCTSRKNAELPIFAFISLLQRVMASKQWY